MSRRIGETRRNSIWTCDNIVIIFMAFVMIWIVAMIVFGINLNESAPIMIQETKKSRIVHVNQGNQTLDIGFASTNQLGTSQFLFIHFGIMCMSEDTVFRSQIRRVLSAQYQAMKKESKDLNFVFNFTFVIGGKNASEELLKERDIYQDLTILDIEENMNEGKTFEWFNYAYNNNQRDEHENYLVFKADMDTMICLDDLMQDLVNVTANGTSKYLYYGKINRNCPEGAWCYAPHHCTRFEGDCWIFHGGPMYGLSMPLIDQIFSNQQRNRNNTGPEDVAVAKWINQSSIREEVEVFSHNECDTFCHVGDLKRHGWNEYHYNLFCVEKQCAGC